MVCEWTGHPLGTDRLLQPCVLGLLATVAGSNTGICSLHQGLQSGDQRLLLFPGTILRNRVRVCHCGHLGWNNSLLGRAVPCIPEQLSINNGPYFQISRGVGAYHGTHSHIGTFEAHSSKDIYTRAPQPQCY